MAHAYSRCRSPTRIALPCVPLNPKLCAAVFEQPKRALVVEDEAKTAAFLRDGLQDHGWSVDVAKDGSDGLRLALKNSYDFVLLEVMLPSRYRLTVRPVLAADGRELAL